MYRFRKAGVAALVAITLVVTGCASDSTITIVSTPGADEPTRSPLPTLAASSGMGDVDYIIQNALAGDEIELAGLVGYQTVACREPGAEGIEPECREGEEGTNVEALAASGCGDAWVRPEAVPDTFRLALAGERTVEAVYVPNYADGTFGGGFGATVVAVIGTGTHEDGQPKASAMHVKDGRVVWLENDCENASELLTPDRIASFLIEPETP